MVGENGKFQYYAGIFYLLSTMGMDTVLFDLGYLELDPVYDCYTAANSTLYTCTPE